MHKVTRENDEYTCTCGLRWGVDEDDPHQSEMIGVDIAHTDGDRTVINGHELYKPSDFTEAEIQRMNVLAVAVVDRGQRVCRQCGAIESDLAKKCRRFRNVSE